MTRVAAALAFLLAAACAAWARAPRPAGPAAARAQAVVQEMTRLARQAEDADPQEAKRLAARVQAFAPEVKALGAAAIGPLSEALGDLDRPFRMRLYAAEFLALSGDPGAFMPLAKCALDVFEKPGLRSAALLAFTGLRVSNEQKRAVLEKSLEGKPPTEVVEEAFSQLADLGAADPDAVILAAAAADLRGAQARNAARAVAAARIASPGPKLLDLLPALSHAPDGESEALGALLRLPPFKAAPGQARAVMAVLARRQGRPAALAGRVAARLALSGAADELRRALKAADPEIVTSAAEALAELRDPKGGRDVDQLLSRLDRDRRFAPGKGVDVAALAGRLKAAAETFHAAPASPAAGEPAAAAAPAADRAEETFSPPRGVFRYDGAPSLDWPPVRFKGGPAKLYGGPDPRTRERSARLPAGELTYDDSVVWTLSPGKARVARKIVLDVRDLGPFTGRYSGEPGLGRRVTLEPGEALRIYGVRDGGDCFVQRGARLLVMECPQFYPGAYVVQSVPVTEWWVRVRARAARGWLTVRFGTAP